MGFTRIKKIIKKLFFIFSPIVSFTISGKSMEPTLQEGQRVIVLKRCFIPINKGTIVIAKDPRNERILIKRVEGIRHSSYFLVGDNKKESTDSRHFGWIPKKNIMGKVIFST